MKKNKIKAIIDTDLENMLKKSCPSGKPAAKSLFGVFKLNP